MIQRLLPRKMICLQLFLLLLAVAVVRSEKYLIIATEIAGGSTKFYRSDFDLVNKNELATETLPSTIDKLFISNHQDDKVLYWSYEGLNNIGCLELNNNKFKSKCLETDQKGTFIGLDKSNNLDFYSPETKTIEVINSKTETNVKSLNALKDSTADWKFTCRNPCNAIKAYFASCSAPITARVFDLENDKILTTYEIDKSFCFDTWALTLNGDRVYGVKDREIYRTKGESYTKYHLNNAKIVHFAVGYNEIFYTTEEEGKIFKLTQKDVNDIVKQTVHDVDGKVTALFAYESGKPDECKS